MMEESQRRRTYDTLLRETKDTVAKEAQSISEYAYMLLLLLIFVIGFFHFQIHLIALNEMVFYVGTILVIFFFMSKKSKPERMITQAEAKSIVYEAAKEEQYVGSSKMPRGIISIYPQVKLTRFQGNPMYYVVLFCVTGAWREHYFYAEVPHTTPALCESILPTDHTFDMSEFKDSEVFVPPDSVLYTAMNRRIAAISDDEFAKRSIAGNLHSKTFKGDGQDA